MFFKRFYLFLERGEGSGRERERNIDVWLPLPCSQMGTWPASQVYALTRNQTSNPLVHGPVLNPLSHTSQGSISYFLNDLLLLSFLSFWNYYFIMSDLLTSPLNFLYSLSCIPDFWLLASFSSLYNQPFIEFLFQLYTFNF